MYTRRLWVTGHYDRPMQQARLRSAGHDLEVLLVGKQDFGIRCGCCMSATNTSIVADGANEFTEDLSGNVVDRDHVLHRLYNGFGRHFNRHDVNGSGYILDEGWTVGNMKV